MFENIPWNVQLATDPLANDTGISDGTIHVDRNCTKKELIERDKWDIPGTNMWSIDNYTIIIK